MSLGDINRVNTNLQAMTSQFSLNKVNNKLADNQLKLSTGLRINKAEDDAAGFSIASKLSARIGGLEQAQRNVGDAKSMLDVAEGGMNTIMDSLVEMKAKAIQGATESIGNIERGYILKQIRGLATEINDTVNQTEFQGVKLLKGDPANANNDGVGGDDGTGTLKLTFQVGEGSNDTKSVSIDGISMNTLFSDMKDGSVSIIGLSIGDETTGSTAMGNIDYGDPVDLGSFAGEVDKAIDYMAKSFNQIGIDQNSLSIKQDNLSQSITSNSAARSRIQDADFAKVQSESIKLQIMQQTSTSALAQANSSPQAVLGFLG